MASFSDLLKKWFYTNSSSAASSDARIPLLTATGEPKGSDTMANIASVLGGVRRFTINSGGDIVISKRDGGSAILALSESMLEGIGFLGRVSYNMASITNLVPTDRTVGWGSSSEEDLSLYYDSSFRLHMKYNGSRPQLQIEVLTLE